MDIEDRVGPWIDHIDSEGIYWHRSWLAGEEPDEASSCARSADVGSCAETPFQVVILKQCQPMTGDSHERSWQRSFR